jgi:DNA-directed RNA polymerase subunit beta'
MMGAVKRGNREIIIEAKMACRRNILFRLQGQILAQDGDFVKAGSALSDGQTSPQDILSIQGPFAVQQYVVNEIQEVYRLQGRKDK